MFLVFWKSKKNINILIGATPKVLKKYEIFAGQVKLIWPEIYSNAFKMTIQSIGMQNKYNLSWYKPLMVVFKKFVRKYFSGMPDRNLLYTSECVLKRGIRSNHPPGTATAWWFSSDAITNQALEH